MSIKNSVKKAIGEAIVNYDTQYVTESILV